ncbi:sensor histidine kinase [Leptospira yanagawae]|uniref:histidine kinase n=1 Tax=Leptospira yanagawae TaxID=293069 RepID=A0ABY2M2W1_9LEPT|nr:HAMP domain-containing sensor histidine kinase [Leptospira yanagawae]TGL18911.1 sensor histidine kinase [Leptospira yanagawae]
MILDPLSLFQASLEGNDYGTAILCIDSKTKHYEILLQNSIFTKLEKEFDTLYFLKNKIQTNNFGTEIIYKVDGKILETSFGHFNYTEGNPGKHYTKFFVRDITIKQKQEEEIAWRLRFELGVASSIQILIQKPSIRESLPQALYQLLYFTEMDSIFFLKHIGTAATETFEIWVNERKTTEFPILSSKFQNLNWNKEGISRWLHKLKNGKLIYLQKEKALPKEKWYFEESKVETILWIPVHFEKQFLGIMGFQKHTPNFVIHHDNLLIFQTISRWMGLFVQRDKDLTELNRYKSSLESLILERTLDLSRTKEELERAYKAKTDFLAHVSHELRTPLNSIIGFSKLIQLPEEDLTGKEYLNYIYSGGTRLLKMINEILHLMRIESGQIELKLSEFKPEDICRQTLELIQPQADAKRMEIRFYPPIQSKTMTSDSGKIQQILLNLLSNAIKYAVHTFVEFHCEWNDSNLLFKVKDFGPGIPEEDQTRIFHSFTRLNDDGKIEGTGLGLSISQGLAEKLGGTIELSSKFGEGSTFTLILPENRK